MYMHGRMYTCMQRLQRWIKQVNQSKLIKWAEWDGMMPPFSFQITVLPCRLWEELHLSHPLVALIQEFPNLLIILARVLLRLSGSMRWGGSSWCWSCGCCTGHWWRSGHRWGNRCWWAAALGLRASRRRFLVILTIWACHIFLDHILQHLLQAPTLAGAEVVNLQHSHTLRPFWLQVEGLPHNRHLKGKIT